LIDLQIFDSTHHLNCVYVILCASDILFRVIELIAMNVLRTRVLAIDMCVRKVLIHIRHTFNTPGNIIKCLCNDSNEWR